MKTDMLKRLGLAMLIAMMAGGLVACEDDPGPAEEAGQNIDEAMEDAGEGIEEMGDEIQDSAEEN
ncbi:MULTISPECIES: hypothetical protein [Halomonas]|uniref:Uncharacterized protein n=1 Tax=Halomonas flagellata TaxID=2920385 RepID=A0ABS9RPD5_9GAMM|nr:MULTISPECIES: hypothetical protein [Halomonas]MCH4561838.1 hypothetical protein [Halomonas flagellata]PXX98090.1 hypothetical protein CR157_07060 [Halomonas sp. LBP4]